VADAGLLGSHHQRLRNRSTRDPNEFPPPHKICPQLAQLYSSCGITGPKVSRTRRRTARRLKRTNERERQRREREEAKDETARQKNRARRQEAVDKAQAALDKAEEEHAQRAAALRAEIEAIEKKLKAEEADWDEEANGLKAEPRRARDPGTDS
jgi:flagellar motility protein MotE (MotC chaperone)